jgi:tetratricopeptide (TPR) repeat protein
MDTYQELLGVDLAPKSEIHNELGQLLIRRSDFEAAVGAFQEGIRLNQDPDSRNLSDLYFNLGHSLRKLGRGNQARQALEKAAAGYNRELEGNPRSSAAHFALGSVFVETRDFERAAEHFRQAVDLDPGDTVNHMNLVKSLEARGLLDQAIEASRRAMIVMSESDRPREAAQFEAYRGSLQKKRRQTRQSRP